MKFGVLCGVPKSECLGGTAQLSKSLERDAKIHSSHEEAFKCYEKYLLRQGFIKIGNREYKDPMGGPIRILTKKCRFGGVLRSGKSESTARGQRGMPKKYTSGIIIPC